VLTLVGEVLNVDAGGVEGGTLDEVSIGGGETGQESLGTGYY
jgi:hypothetical protein